MSCTMVRNLTKLNIIAESGGLIAILYICNGTNLEESFVNDYINQMFKSESKYNRK